MSHPSVADQIRTARLSLGWSQATLAQRCGMNGQNEISRIETGRSRPLVDTLERIARALGVALVIAPD